jgi:hypothetical protein
VEETTGREVEGRKNQVGLEGRGEGRGGRVQMRGAPAEVAARDREGRDTPKSEGMREED